MMDAHLSDMGVCFSFLYLQTPLEPTQFSVVSIGKTIKKTLSISFKSNSEWVDGLAQLFH